MGVERRLGRSRVIVVTSALLLKHIFLGVLGVVWQFVVAVMRRQTEPQLEVARVHPRAGLGWARLDWVAVYRSVVERLTMTINGYF